jgi:hypothetical protein
MKVLRATLVVAVLTAGAMAAQPLTPRPDAVESDEAQGLVAREWVWRVGETTTTFTASGPSDQVNRLNPQADPLQCQGCALASSTSYEPGDEGEPVPSE